MGLYKDWTDLMQNQTEETFEKFWEEYAGTEGKIYDHILSTKEKKLTGKVSELIEKFEADPVIFMGFLDGINSSLRKPLDLEKITKASNIDLDIDLELLYFNMLKADADYLYTLPQWEKILTEAKRIEILKKYKNSKTVHVEKKPGRNEPCPCGSGKKYKNCCGRNA